MREQPAQVQPGLQQAFSHTGPVLVDVVTDPNVLSMPPHIDASQFKGFALAMGKMILSHRTGEIEELIEANLHHS